MRRSRLTASVGAVCVLSVWALGGSAAPSSAAPLLGRPIPQDVITASAAPGSHWTPDPAVYGVGKTADLPVTMADGTVLRADVYYPTENGKQAAGKFPVVLTQTPYSRQVVGEIPQSVLGTETGSGSDYLVRRGYLSVVADLRGTGASEGSLDLLDPVLGSDGATLVRWAAKLPGSNGKVGTHGASYLGLIQLLTAASMGPGSPLKAIFPAVTPEDLYKDAITMGGLFNAELGSLLPTILGILPVPGTLANGLADPADTPNSLNPELAQRLTGLAEFEAPFLAQMVAGGDVAFDDAFWQSRRPAGGMQRIVDNGIAAYLIGGHYDVSQRAAPLNYVGLQNAFAGRPVDAPMASDQPVTGRYQLLVLGDAHVAATVADYAPLQLRWFDTFLKDRDTGMTRTPTPLHVYDLGTDRYVHAARYPFPNAQPTRFYLSGERSGSAPLSRNDGTLATTRPTQPGTDTVPWLPIGNPCNRAIDQWSLGAISLVTDRLPGDVPCLDDDRLGTLGLDRLTYTSAPLTEPQTIAGPITMTVYASANRPETQWVVQVDDVAPDGSAKPLTQGALLGSLRKLDPATTWTTPDGEIPLQAGHSYSRGSQAPVIPGELTRYDIEVFPTYDTLAEGHRIRMTLSTADTPHLVPSVPAALDLLGGVYTIQRSPGAPSAIQIPLIPAG